MYERNYVLCWFKEKGKKPTDLKNCKHCPHFTNCTLIEHLKINTTINTFEDFQEIICYNHHFPKNIQNNNKDINRTRKWHYNKRGVLVANNEDITIKELNKSIEHSRKRTIDNIYSLALCNEFNYWVTLTIENAKEFGDAYSQEVFKQFMQRLKYLKKDVKYLFVIEKHKKGGVHFHGLIGNIDLSKQLIQGIDKKEYIYTVNHETGEKIYKLDSLGQLISNPHYMQPMTDTYNGRQIPIYNFIKDFYSYGWTTIVEIQKDSPRLQVINYLSKYMKKDTCNLDYNKRAFFKSDNLNKKNKVSTFLKKQDVEYLLNKDLSFNVVQHKSNEKVTVYRIYKRQGD